MDDNNIFIGRKPSMSYVLAVVTQFNTGASSVTIKARGRAISKAVDVSEIVRNRFMKDVIIDSISTGTEKVADEGSDEGINVSWIEIVVMKEKAAEEDEE